MRLSEMNGKEVIDFRLGERMGQLGSADVIIDEHTGKVEAFLLPVQGWLPFRKKGSEVNVPWGQIKTIGDDYMIIDLDTEIQY